VGIQASPTLRDFFLSSLSIQKFSLAKNRMRRKPCLLSCPRLWDKNHMCFSPSPVASMCSKSNNLGSVAFLHFARSKCQNHHLPLRDSRCVFSMYHIHGPKYQCKRYRVSIFMSEKRGSICLMFRRASPRIIGLDYVACSENARNLELRCRVKHVAFKY
jgi:hypothetical protein